MTHDDDRIAEEKVCGLPTNSQFTRAISHPNWHTNFCSCGAIACRSPKVRAEKMKNMDRIGSGIHTREVMVDCLGPVQQGIDSLRTVPQVC